MKRSEKLDKTDEFVLAVSEVIYAMDATKAVWDLKFDRGGCGDYFGGNCIELVRKQAQRIGVPVSDINNTYGVDAYVRIFLTYIGKKIDKSLSYTN
jgi:hypothetical protein